MLAGEVRGKLFSRDTVQPSYTEWRGRKVAREGRSFGAMYGGRLRTGRRWQGKLIGSDGSHADDARGQTDHRPALPAGSQHCRHGRLLTAPVMSSRSTCRCIYWQALGEALRSARPTASTARMRELLSDTSGGPDVSR